MAQNRVRKDIEQIVQQYVHYLQDELKLQGVFIYGSFVNGNATEDSDIDVAVVADDFTGDQIEDTFRLMKIRRKVDYRIEPHPFRSEEFRLNHPYAKEVLENGFEVSVKPVH